MKYEYAKNPRWANAERSVIELIVKFEHLGEEVPFSAAYDDEEAHGVALFNAANQGRFGEIEQYVPPTEMELASIESPRRRSAGMDKAVEQAKHWDMMGDATLSTKWRGYYRDLFELITKDTWPIVQEWPLEPGSSGGGE